MDGEDMEVLVLPWGYASGVVTLRPFHMESLGGSADPTHL